MLKQLVNRPRRYLAAPGQELPQPDELSHVRRAIFVLALPVVAEMSLETVNQIVGMAFVGHLGAEAVAAIGLSTQPLFLAMGLFRGLSVGTTALIARFIGSGDRQDANKVLNLSFVMAFIMAGALAVVALAYGPGLIALMGGEPEVQALGGLYLRNYAIGLAFMLVNMVLSSALRGAGDTHTPMYANTLVSLTNIPLTYAMVYGLPVLGLEPLGVGGAGWARSLSTSLGFVVLMVSLLGGRKVLQLKLSQLCRIDWPLAARTIRIGLPATLERFLISSGQILYVRQVSELGTLAYAAHAIAVNAESVSYMPGFGFATSATTLVGQNLGAGRPDRAMLSGWESWKLGATLMGFMGLLFLTIPHILLRIYTSDPEIIAMASMCLRIMALAQIPMAAGFIFPGALHGAGDTKSVLYVSTLGVWVVRLGLTFVLVQWLGLGLFGAWVAMACDWYFRGIILAKKFLAGRWRELRI